MVVADRNWIAVMLKDILKMEMLLVRRSPGILYPRGIFVDESFP